ncbi:MAG: hypothetical protein FWD78_17505 [Treponema sp.]|nr:hypothetical protein [Treponema sp.]
MIHINCVSEDEPSLAVMQKMLDKFTGCFSISQRTNAHGFARIRSRIKAYNNAAAFAPYFIITDLDKNECAPTLIRDWLGEPPNKNMLFRVAEREIESWLMADRKNFAKFIGVSYEKIPFRPDEIKDPKGTLISLVKKSRNKALQTDMVPKNNSASIGPYYNAQLRNFILSSWDIQTAMGNSPSLLKAYLALQKFAAEQVVGSGE